MTEKNNERSTRRPDCVTEIRRGNTILKVSGFYNQNTTVTAEDKMMKLLELELSAGLLNI